MSISPSPSLQIELLKEEQAHLHFLRERHLRWMHALDDLEISHMHRAIADLIQETTDRFGILLEALEVQRDKEADHTLKNDDV